MPVSSRHLLVIRLSAMGDVAMTVPVLLALTKQYPELKLTVVSRPFFAPVFSTIPNVTFYGAQLNSTHKGVNGLYQLSKELRGLKCDAVADLHSVLRTHILKLFFTLQGLPVQQIDKGRKEKKALTRTSGKIFKPIKTTHQRYADVFEKQGFPISLTTPAFLTKRTLTPPVNKMVGEGQKPWIGIAPFAAFKGKMYPLDLMEEVIKQLDANGLFKIILFGGGKKETDVLETIASNYNSVINIAGKLSFEEELQVISNLNIMVAMDSGNAHLAAMFGVKTITLWGVTHPYAGFAPYQQPEDLMILADRTKYPAIPTSVYGKKLPEGYEEVMRTIPPDLVYNTVLREVK
ncbi:glycosyltransferase family 9 protein [Ascidiimonas aurantiaca]|uniref:glycosyltransferase family 9 protein n=1 Tax=Ascidiimonas aurantiaca TaxID=1685432 RepID=UPI0030EE08B9